MFINIRANSVPYYRLMFIALFVVLGLVGTGITALDYFLDISILEAGSQGEQDALHATSFFIGMVGFFNASLMTYLLKEKRTPGSDRRRHSQAIHFKDRRSASDRRNNTESIAAD